MSGRRPESSVAGSDFIPGITYRPEISLQESLGGKARRLWEQRFLEIAPYAGDSEIIYSGIGGAPGRNAEVFVRQHGDTLITPSYLDLKKTYGRIPKILFLPVSLTNADHLIGLRSIARHYKQQGVSTIIVIATSLVHERQDHQFSQDGEPILEGTTLEDVVDILTHGDIDGGFIQQPHSLRSVELAMLNKFPFIPIDAFPFLIRNANLRKIRNPFILGPDKGRKDEARILATQLNCPVGSALKERARLDDGSAKMTIPDKILEYIQRYNCTVIVLDDEIREGTTIGGLAHGLDGYAEGMVVCVVKPIFAALQDHPATAIDFLKLPIIKRIVVTDAVRPLTDCSPIQHKLEVLKVQPEIEKLVSYLQNNFVQPGNPDWLRDPQQTGTLLRLDLSIEHVG
jgi:phosphoribosylpyrophosphate synthetase